MLEEYYVRYPKMARNKVGIIFYPIMVETTKILNNKYATQLTKFSQMVTDVKQLYLDVIVKKGIFQFKTVPFKTATFLFEQKSWKYIFIHAGYWIVSFAIMGAIICGWV